MNNRSHKNNVNSPNSETVGLDNNAEFQHQESNNQSSLFHDSPEINLRKRSYELTHSNSAITKLDSNKQIKTKINQEREAPFNSDGSSNFFPLPFELVDTYHSPITITDNSSSSSSSSSTVDTSHLKINNTKSHANYITQMNMAANESAMYIEGILKNPSTAFKKYDEAKFYALIENLQSIANKFPEIPSNPYGKINSIINFALLTDLKRYKVHNLPLENFASGLKEISETNYHAKYFFKKRTYTMMFKLEYPQKYGRYFSLVDLLNKLITSMLNHKLISTTPKHSEKSTSQNPYDSLDLDNFDLPTLESFINITSTINQSNSSSSLSLQTEAHHHIAQSNTVVLNTNNTVDSDTQNHSSSQSLSINIDGDAPDCNSHHLNISLSTIPPNFYYNFFNMPRVGVRTPINNTQMDSPFARPDKSPFSLPGPSLFNNSPLNNIHGNKTPQLDQNSNADFAFLPNSPFS